MNWIEELKSPTSREIGLATQIRTVMKNEWLASADDLRDFIGPDWRELVEDFRRKGQLRVQKTRTRYILRIVLPGDRKREKIRKLAAKKRKGQKGPNHEET